jgi:hypothetical protein
VVEQTARSEFLARVRQAEGGCWEWTGGTYRGGYGRAFVRRRDMRAHRLAWALFVGPIPDGLQVLHRCDNPPCVNPAHLFLGTHRENMADRDAKGRVASGDRAGARTRPERLATKANGRHMSVTHPERVARGERNAAAKLTAARAAEIRRRYGAGGISQRQLGREYGVDQSVISGVVRGRIWKEAPPPAPAPPPAKPRRVVRPGRVAQTCAGCGQPFLAKASEVRKGWGRYCSRACYDTHHPRRRVHDVAGRFWAKVDRGGGPDACWPWTGQRRRNGRGQAPYGQFTPHRGEPPVLAHRLSWALTNGPIPDALWVLHRCDTALCVNPAHLSLGDHDQNMREMVARRRSTRGERHYAAKLTWHEVRAIRARYVRGVYGVIRLAKAYGVSERTVREILRGRRWKEWDGELER